MSVAVRFAVLVPLMRLCYWVIDRASNLWFTVTGFKSRLGTIALGKLLTPVYLCHQAV